MNVVNVFWTLMILMLLALWVEESWKLGTRARDYTLHFAGICWCAMMRHSGDTRYTYQARRYRS